MEDAESIVKRHCVPVTLTYRTHNKIVLNEVVYPNLHPATTFAKFMYMRRLEIANMEKKPMDATEGYYCLIRNGNVLPMANQTLMDLYSRYKSKNGFLELELCKENVFGN